MPILFGDKALDGKSIKQLIQGKPLFPPIEGLDKALWFNHCTNCHQWNQERLCEQAKNYIKPTPTSCASSTRSARASRWRWATGPKTAASRR